MPHEDQTVGPEQYDYSRFGRIYDDCRYMDAWGIHQRDGRIVIDIPRYKAMLDEGMATEFLPE